MWYTVLVSCTAVFWGYHIASIWDPHMQLLVCTWRHGGHVGGQEQKHFSPLGTKLYFHVNSSRKYSFVLTPNMAALSCGCKPRIVLKNEKLIELKLRWVVYLSSGVDSSKPFYFLHAKWWHPTGMPTPWSKQLQFPISGHFHSIKRSKILFLGLADWFVGLRDIFNPCPNHSKDILVGKKETMQRVRLELPDLQIQSSRC